MTDTPGKTMSDEMSQVFAQLDPEEVEQFYASYKLWELQQRIASLQSDIDALRQQIAANREQMQQATPSPIALASLARLQSHGVNDIDLLDRMLEHGEQWLDRAMQHLEYCEQMGFIHDNYSEWCEHALEGAYDWIDSIQQAGSAEAPSEARGIAEQTGDAQAAQPETTEEIFFQKLMSEDMEAAEEDESALETTLKQAAVPATPMPEASKQASAPLTTDEVTAPAAYEAPAAGAEIGTSSSQNTQEQSLTSNQAGQAEPEIPAREEQPPQEMVAGPSLEQRQEAIPAYASGVWQQDTAPMQAQGQQGFVPQPAQPARKRNLLQWLIYVISGK